jgi:hypothetical protein
VPVGVKLQNLRGKLRCPIEVQEVEASFHQPNLLVATLLSLGVRIVFQAIRKVGELSAFRATELRTSLVFLVERLSADLEFRFFVP